MGRKKKAYHHFSLDPAPSIQRDPRAPTGPRGPNDTLMTTPYRVEINTCYNTNAEKTYKNIHQEAEKDRARMEFMTAQHTLLQYADASEGKHFMREQISHKRLKAQLRGELRLDDRSLLAVRQARMAEMVLGEARQIDSELEQRSLALYDQII